MKQVIGFSAVGVVAFLIGLSVSPFWSSSKSHESVVEVTPPPGQPATRESRETTFEDFANNAASTPVTSSIQQASFERNADIAEDVVPAALATKAHDRNPDETQAVIRRYFPDLQPDELQGWVDSYVDLPKPELEALLQQKQQLPGLLPSASTLRTADLDVEFENPNSNSNDLWLHRSIIAAQSNLRHWNTFGFRRTRLQMSFVANVNDSSRAEPDQRDFSPGPVSDSDGPLHFAIRGHRHVFFRLEPGCVLTRLGRFRRIEEQPGMRLPDGTVVMLPGEMKIPATARDVRFNSNGQLRYENADSEEHVTDELQLARVHDLSRLHSTDGVFFRLPEGENDACLELFSASKIANDLSSWALEGSNVDRDVDWENLRHLERIAGFSGMSAK